MRKKALFYYLFILLKLSGCSKLSNENGKASITRSDSVVAHKDSSILHQLKLIEYSDTVYQLLISNGILPENYPKSGILSQELFEIERKKIGLVKIAYDKSLDQDTITPVQNIIYTRNSTALTCFKIVPSIYEDDFLFMFKKDDYLVFSFYSSPVGYTELYIFESSKNKLLRSERLDEADHIDSDLFTISDMSFDVIDYADKRVKKKLTVLSWENCQ